MSGLVANDAVMRFQFLFRESEDGRGSLFDGMIWIVAEVEDGFSFQVEYGSGHSFYSGCGFYDGGWGSVHGGASCRRGSGEGWVLFSLGLFWAKGIRE